MWSIDQDVMTTSRYIHFDSQNYNTFSTELMNILIRSCTGIEDILKSLLTDIDEKKRRNNIKDYFQITKEEHFDKLNLETIIFTNTDIEFKPFGKWEKETPPQWWTKYNKIKHNKEEYLSYGNFKNALNAFGGLFLLTLYYYKYFEFKHNSSYILEPEPYSVGLPDGRNRDTIISHDYILKGF